MTELHSLCVYCGSSRGRDGLYLEGARHLGRLAADRGVRIVYGGGRVGMMGALADAALAAGGKVMGIIPHHLERLEVGHSEVTTLEVVDTMHERKMRMFEESDAFCVLPGGLGTLDEAFEMVTWRQLGLHEKPLVLVNLEGFWSPLLALLEHQTEAGFLRREHLDYVTVVERVEAVFDAVARAPGATHPPQTKWA